MADKQPEIDEETRLARAWANDPDFLRDLGPDYLPLHPLPEEETEQPVFLPRLAKAS